MTAAKNTHGLKGVSSSPGSVALVVPCFNEAKRLPVARLVGQADMFNALVFVNDGSTDGTAGVLDEITNALAMKILDTHVHSIAAAVGKGEAVRQGVRAARSRYPGCDVALADADLSTPLPEIARLAAERARRGVDIMQGARVALAGKTIVRSRTRHWLGRIGQTLMCELLDLHIHDVRAGARVFRGAAADRLFEEPFVSRWLFDCEIFLRAREMGCEVEEEPLQEWRQVDGSGVRPWTYAGAPAELLAIRRRYRRVPRG